jgi:hypothetical protein
LLAIRLTAETPVGAVGHTLQFSGGLNVIRADNSSGKSTTLQAIVYALGVEGMLSARREVPLPHAMTDEVSVAGTEAEVISSSVELEIENGSSEVVTVKRYVKHPTISTQLVTVSDGSAIREGESAATRDFFVRRPGSAQREAGFHRFLAEFIGWTLPQVSRMDGSECPLYLETLFPYFYVEQKHGWSGVQARIPTYFGIRDVGRRSAEYVLDLEVFQRILTAQRIRSTIGLLDAEWKETFVALSMKARTAGAALAAAPRSIADSGDPESGRIIVYVGEDWLPIAEAVEALGVELQARESRPVATVGEMAEQMETDLGASEREVVSTMTRLAVVLDERSELDRRAEELEQRIDALGEDLQRQHDALTLADLGSQAALSVVGERVCPTCHQDVCDGMDVTAHAMTAAESIRFIQRQLATFRASLEDVTRASRAMELRESSLREELATQRRRVRTAREALAERTQAPSVADVSERVALRDRVDRLREAAEELESLRSTLADLALAHVEQRKRLGDVDVFKLSEGDAEKLAQLQTYVRSQLGRYHFSSLAPEQVDISHETYRPVNEGFDLGFDLSASDMIRLIWSYLLALLRVSEEHSGQHPGLLIFDEPRQQETASSSFRELLHEAAEQGARGSQVIFATSEPRDALLTMLEGADYTLLDIPAGEKLLRAIEPGFETASH